MTLTGFSTCLRHVVPNRRDVELEALATALHSEFPAFRVVQVTVLDDRAVLQVSADDGTPAHAIERLDGWGYGRLTLRP